MSSEIVPGRAKRPDNDLCKKRQTSGIIVSYYIASEDRARRIGNGIVLDTGSTPYLVEPGNFLPSPLLEWVKFRNQR